ncbi:hypothetical protein G7B40_008915 [Aetokthonos hydrillicola Thurmond2011]|jgi:hypothetical protein|uniref:Uncharacterized protein n=1 Tax=Aetokthonos hydrillicola Thurmond2011 TaxID=2712845 RepID=A0AAP5I913_9CYAN|nr:hypothetical protein [Aetokthonos hydrillicola]MBO3457627.1 hypothetical protein [Aetokthonos hydrillicola CCALA 1050]MBW4587905.1 hypothetical protein [Aetokthonos hydrillicola CCALA 1050]MDR9894690.1 hypothetical protein [Aetokthonos hydrillicola Thurmond2011]
MEENQQQQRRAAAKEFLQSLNQLENMLQVNENQDEQEIPELNSGINDEQVATSPLTIDLEAFEDAVADIEQYFEQGSKQC